MLETVRPLLNLLTTEHIKRILHEAIDVLGHVGMIVDNLEALSLLQDAGAQVDRSSKIVKFQENLITDALKKAPSSVCLYDRFGKPVVAMEGHKVHFDPGSAALRILDRNGTVRKPVTEDYVKFCRLVEHLPAYDANSTALICADVPESIQDIYRLYLTLQHCTKPVVTGAFCQRGALVMMEMLSIIRGSREKLAEQPFAIFDCCPSSPLKWSEITCQNLIDCARARVPVELISMPLSGAVAPVTLEGTIVQHAAETLSGVVLTQLVNPGAPVIYGGSPAAFDMRHGTTPMGAVETVMIDCSYAQLGRHLGLPTHAYMGLSDSKLMDAQAGFESAMGILLGSLAGVNMISGPGMLDFESCQSLEKLVIDHEICLSAKRLLRGIAPHPEDRTADLLQDIHEKEHMLTHPHTLQWMMEEVTRPSELIDHANRDASKVTSMLDRAAPYVEKLLKRDPAPALPESAFDALHQVMRREAGSHGVDKLPHA